MVDLVFCGEVATLRCTVVDHVEDVCEHVEVVVCYGMGDVDVEIVLSDVLWLVGDFTFACSWFDRVRMFCVEFFVEGLRVEVLFAVD